MLDINISHDCFDLHQRSKESVKECDSWKMIWMDCDPDGAQCYLSWDSAAPQNIYWRLCLRPLNICSHLSLVDSGIAFSIFRLEPQTKKTKVSKFVAVFLLYCFSEQIAHEMIWRMYKSSSDFAKEASKVLCCSQTGKVHVMFDALLLPQRLASESLGKQQPPEGLREWTVELFTYSQQQSS